jgi:hypothetical protein
LDCAELRDTTLRQEKRRLRLMTVTDAEQAGAAFDLCMGDDVAPPRAFIIDEGGLLDEGVHRRLARASSGESCPGPHRRGHPLTDEWVLCEVRDEP